MQTEKGQFSSEHPANRPYQLSVRKAVSAIFLLILLGAFVAPNAMACHKNNKPHGPHTCDGGGSGTTVAGFPTLAAFIGPSGIQDGDARFCTPRGELLTTGGTYDCLTGEGVHFSTHAMTFVGRKRDTNFCNSLGSTAPIANVPAIQPASYSYGWTDDCGDDACRIEVNMSFRGPGISAATGGDSDAVDVQVSGTLMGVDLPGNPFDLILELPISQISMQWYKPGSSDVKAVCDFSPMYIDLGAPYSVTLRSDPILP